MTVEQLEQANEIFKKIKKLKVFKSYAPNIIASRYPVYAGVGDAYVNELKLNLDDFPDLQDFISGYLSDKIAELEKQLEEL